MISGTLILEDGTIFEGNSIGHPGEVLAETVFNTGMTGYQEMLTDNSYANQILVLASAHIGNVGVNEKDLESNKPSIAGLVVNNFSKWQSNWRAKGTLSDYLKQNSIVAISDIDTRALVHIIRNQGVMRSCLITGTYKKQEILRTLKDLNTCNMNIAREISAVKSYEFWDLQAPSSLLTKQNSPRIVVMDFGVKYSILNHLKKRECKVFVVPATASISEILALNPDGILLSNGPGDPATYKDIINTVRFLVDSNLIIFGICLGCQLLAIALGGVTVKMKYGHRGTNHPVQDLFKKEVLITSQNHGYVIDEHYLPETLEVTHRSLFDNSLQGIKHRVKPIFGFQGHPEGGPGPSDAQGMFDIFINQIKKGYYAKTY